MCVGRCKRLFCCLSGGGGTRAPSSSSPLRTIGPAQSAGRVWLEGGSDTKGRGLWSAVAERGGLVCRSEQKREKKEFSVWKTAVAERGRARVNESQNQDLRLRGSFWQFGKLQAVEMLLVCRRSERSERT